MGAGIAIDGRTATSEVLEQKLAETMALTAKPFRKEHGAMQGRQKAMEIIERIAGRKQS